jgi:hypothetical protein
MSEYRVKLAAALPKGESNGFADYTIVGALAETTIEGHSVQPRVALMVYDVKTTGIDPDDGTKTVVLRIRRVQPVLTVEGRRQAEQMLADEFAAQTGQAMLPYDLSALSKSAFADLPRSTEEIDQREADEQDLMSPTDELRRHIEVVHGSEDARTMTAEEAEEKHRADHDGDVLGPLDHDREWFGWTRADLEQAEFQADDTSVGDADNAAMVDRWNAEGVVNAEGVEVADDVTAEAGDQPDEDDVTPLFSTGGLIR